MNDFSKLLIELDDLQKALPVKDKDDEPSAADKKDGATKVDDPQDDKRIEAAAKDGEKQGDKDDEVFGKSFQVKLEDGTVADAFDGTAMLKALHSENDALRAQIVDIHSAFEKAIDAIRTLRTAQSEQGSLVKALQGKVGDLGAAGTGRRTMLAVAEKLSPSAGIADKPTATAGSVMMKAQQLVRAGTLGLEAMPRIEAWQGRGQLAPPDLLARFPELLTPVG